ncbi:MAG: hypothetical protein JW871_02975, partial [Endomicrobiales bacterium]|nr:hypothetical protein [Endomicrobiales bacterium]
PHSYGWSDDFIREMEARAPNQDYYEYTWSGFTMSGTLPSAWAVNTTHGIATNGFMRASRAIQAKGYRNVNIISHSWGTVISRDAQYAGVGNINTWVTMGSPLPDDTARPGNLNYWLNIWCSGDPVVYAGKAIALTGIENPGYGYLFESSAPHRHLELPAAYPKRDIRNHGVYWTDTASLNSIGVSLNRQ